MSSWQDWTLGVSVLAFNIALIPSVYGEQKPRMATSILTALFLVPEIIVFASLALRYSFAMATLNSCLWATLAVQRYFQIRAAAVQRS